MPTKFQFCISETLRKNRLDNFLCDEITAVSKMYLRALLINGGCAVNGEIKFGGYHLQKDDLVELEVDLSADTAMKPEDIPLEIVFEDEEIIVVNKAAGMLVHPTLGRKSGTLLNALSFYLNFSTRRRGDAETNKEFCSENQSQTQNSKLKFIRPALVHRLDRATSGLIIVAKTKHAHKVLSDHFTRRLIEKKYLAIVEGNVAADSGKIIQPIGRFEESRRWNVKADGKFAETRFLAAKRFSGKTLLELEPVTGRTNQLRIHCAFVGHPIIGDETYGGEEFWRLCLHAASLSFWHPNGNQWLEFECELPSEMKLLIEN